MPPYARDAGMTEHEARLLAERVARELGRTATVEREGRYYVLVLATSSGTHTLRDEADWAWLRRQGPDR